MGTYKKYVDDLEIQKGNLVTALNEKGVAATDTETLNTLVPKVANIESAKEEQEKSVTISASGAKSVTSDTGKVLSKVTITTPAGVQQTPTIAISSSGVVTATTKITTSGFLSSTNSTKSTTKQIPSTVGGNTITPGTSDKVAIAAGVFARNKITVAGDANLTAANIKEGTSIFGVTGTHAGQKTEQTKTVALSMASGNQTVNPDSGKVLSKVTITKPDTLIPENIKKDITIGGVVGTLESGSSSGGGAYNIETTDNSDGTQNLIITDATGGSSGLEFIDVSFKDTAFQDYYTIKSIQPNGTWGTVADNIQLDYTAKVYSVCKQGFAVKSNMSYGANATRILRLSNIIDVFNAPSGNTHIFYVTGNNPSFVVEES